VRANVGSTKAPLSRRWRRLRFGAVVLAGTVLGLAGTARALDLFFKASGIDGESAPSGYAVRCVR